MMFYVLVIRLAAGWEIEDVGRAVGVAPRLDAANLKQYPPALPSKTVRGVPAAAVLDVATALETICASLVVDTPKRVGFGYGGGKFEAWPTSGLKGDYYSLMLNADGTITQRSPTGKLRTIVRPAPLADDGKPDYVIVFDWDDTLFPTSMHTTAHGPPAGWSAGFKATAAEWDGKLATEMARLVALQNSPSRTHPGRNNRIKVVILSRSKLGVRLLTLNKLPKTAHMMAQLDNIVGPVRTNGEGTYWPHMRKHGHFLDVTSEANMDTEFGGIGPIGGKKAPLDKNLYEARVVSELSADASIIFVGDNLPKDFPGMRDAIAKGNNAYGIQLTYEADGNGEDYLHCGHGFGEKQDKLQSQLSLSIREIERLVAHGDGLLAARRNKITPTTMPHFLPPYKFDGKPYDGSMNDLLH